MNMFSHIKLIILDSGRKAFPFAVCTCSGRLLGMFKNRKDAAAYCTTDAQAFV